MTRGLADEVKARRAASGCSRRRLPSKMWRASLFLASLARQVTDKALRVDAGQLIG
ncbi:MAG: hypothetical protein U0Q12_02815 [Vicinamibacterales bacterium]